MKIYKYILKAKVSQGQGTRTCFIVAGAVLKETVLPFIQIMYCSQSRDTELIGSEFIRDKKEKKGQTRFFKHTKKAFVRNVCIADYHVFSCFSNKLF